MLTRAGGCSGLEYSSHVIRKVLQAMGHPLEMTKVAGIYTGISGDKITDSLE